mmetsp:Transcript_15354/g.25280  ORF Transcript_15354/g.25280 Transcript_15354/m.25280 type:complete len:253 (-) Transcript_15354:30-788(-)
MMWSPLLIIASSICMIITHLSGSVNCFVLPSYNIPFGTQKRLAPATGTASGDEDFASFNSEDGGDDGMQLASEFYQELEYRRKHGEETYTVSEPKQRKMFSTQTRQNAATQKPAVSAGLFSGGGSTVYSSGRSIRAEIDILNRSMTEDTKGRERWNVDFELSPEQMENLLKILGSSLVFIAIAGVIFEVSGGGASTITLFNDAAKDGITSMISVGKGEVFMGEEAAWLMKESSALSASIVDAVTSVERIVLF